MPSEEAGIALREVPLLDGPVAFEGALGLERGDGWLQPWRLPPDEVELHHPGLVRTASFPSGVRLRFAGNPVTLRLLTEHVVLEGPAMPVRARYDLVVDGQRLASFDVPEGESGEQTVTFGLPPGDKLVEIWLPLFACVRVRALYVDREAELRPAPDNRPRWVAYGSSITHGAGAVHPTDAWPAVAAQRLGWHVTNMGYAGMCHLDPYVARAIARLPADRITLKLGINIHNLGTLRERTFAPMVHGFIATVRDGHPETPITVISPIASPTREQSVVSEFTFPSGAFRVEGDLTLQKIRAILADVVDVRRRRGDQALTYLDGRELLGEADAHLLPDGLHPNPEGYRLMGERFAARFAAEAAAVPA
jgi:lysophospholipase L1-like esterase